MDRQQELVERVQAAVATATPLQIRGGGTKDFYGGPAAGEPLDVSGHRGVLEYDPGELVITCRSGTPLEEVRAVLAKNGQHLPFDPPAFAPDATIGGTVACGFSGPARPWKGSLRDYLLGVKIINGHGQVLRFGGQVMKNVAGYDVSRLMAGAMGTLGVLLEVSFKILPRPARELSLGCDCSQEDAIRRVNRWSGQALPLSGACWHEGTLRLRLSGAISETERAAERLSIDISDDQATFWNALREQRLPFFENGEPLWRLSVNPATAPIDLPGDCLVDWGGAQRWYISQEAAPTVRAAAESVGGHATRFRGGPEDDRFHPLPPGLQALQERVRRAFDPHGLFNPGRTGRAR